MFEKLRVGAEYTRKSLDEVIGTSKIEKSREGILYLPKDTLLFVTLHKQSKPAEHHYNDFFERDFFHWDSQNQQHINTPRIQQFVRGDVKLHLFTRVRDKVRSITQPFIYCGRLEYLEHDPKTANPVHVVCESVDYQESPTPHLAHEI